MGHMGGYTLFPLRGLFPRKGGVATWVTTLRGVLPRRQLSSTQIMGVVVFIDAKNKYIRAATCPVGLSAKGVQE